MKLKLSAGLATTNLLFFGLTAQAGFFNDLGHALVATNTATATAIVTNASPTASTNAAPKAGLLSGLLASSTNSAVAALSSDQVGSGLKEALGKGVERAVTSLGQNNGFLTNLNVKILMPEKLQKVESALRLAGQGQLVDDFIGSMNHAAEQAVPVAAGVFGDSLKQMSISDAKGILSGTPDAATQYFRRTTQTNLQTKFYPLVQKATDSVGVTAKYKAMMGKFTAVNTVGSLLGSKSTVNLGVADIDSYVTDKAMDGLFKMVAEEEKNIRANPIARTTDLLQKVFGTAAR